jgi:phospholipid/cholesterol/gamma-HCH transport system substrate-binding protein
MTTSDVGPPTKPPTELPTEVVTGLVTGLVTESPTEPVFRVVSQRRTFRNMFGRRTAPSGPRTNVAARRLLAVVLAVAVLVAAGAVFGVRALLSTPTTTITADFTEAPGIYLGNHVDVLGIPVGTITGITPHPTYVAVTMQVKRSVKIPAHAIAALMAPDLVNDRYIQLDPVFRHGAVMTANGVIPMNHTALPESVDQIISTLDQLVQALGPNGVNKSGALSRFVHDVAQTVGHNGPSFHTTITALGQALAALSSDGPDLTTILDNVGTFTNEAAANTTEFQTFANDLASVSGFIAADSSDIGTTLQSLQSIMGQVTSFVQNNRVTLGATLSNLDTFAAQVVSQQQQLGAAFDEGGLVLQNLNQAIITEPNGTTSLRIRYDPSLDTPSFARQLCGQELTRILELGAQGTKSSELNLACAATSALGAMTPPPNAAQGPNLSLSALMGDS